MKRDLFGKRMSATVALFDLTRSNILVYLPPAFTTPSLMGEQNSRGLEFDVSGEIRPGRSWIGTYAYTDATVKRDPSLPQGDALANVPRHSGSLWTTYSFSGDWKGFGIGGGMVAVGQREANLPNTYKLPGYARVDAMAWYEQGPWRAQLNIGNLLDKHYVTGGEAGVFNYTLDPSPPRNGQLTLTYTF